MNISARARFLQKRSVAGAALGVFLLVTAIWWLYTPGGLLGKADAIGYAVCHRISLRSFHLGDRQISMCARCTGMYLGVLIGLAYQATFSRRRGGRPTWMIIAILGLITVAFGLDGVNSLTNLIPDFPSLYQTTNTIRVFLGTGFGIALSAIVFPGFNQSVWRNVDPRPAIPNIKGLVILLALGVVIALLALTGNPLILYPFSLLSALGAVLLLTMAYTMLTLVIFRAENEFESWRQLGAPLVAGMTLGLLQIAGADFVRFLLTGTWDGFHF